MGGVHWPHGRAAFGPRLLLRVPLEFDARQAAALVVVMMVVVLVGREARGDSGAMGASLVVGHPGHHALLLAQGSGVGNHQPDGQGGRG